VLRCLHFLVLLRLLRQDGYPERYLLGESVTKVIEAVEADFRSFKILSCVLRVEIDDVEVSSFLSCSFFVKIELG
jgi:DNA-binding IclR family transcriptional regulator